MSLALVVVAALLGVAAAGSAIQKLRRDPKVMESMRSVGVSTTQLPVLAYLEIAGALGLLVGIWVPWIGAAGSIGLTLYFLGAVAAHVRAKSPAKDSVPAIFLTLLAAAVLVLELLR